MKAKHCILVLLLLSAHCAFSQHALKLGVGYQLLDEGSTTSQQFKADVPSYFKFRTAHKYMEAGLAEFSVSSEQTSGLFPTKKAFNISPFYEFGRLIGSTENKVRFRIGGRILFENQFKRSAGGSADYKYSSFDIGLTLAINPGIQYKLGEKLSIDLGVPFRLITISSHFHKQQGPNFPGVMKRNDGLEGELLPKVYQFKVGVIYRLGQ